MGAVEEIRQAGQAIWLDDISTTMLDDGSLASWRERCGVSGVTANPTIFENAIGNGAYDQVIAASDKNAEATFWDLAVNDVRRAADLFAEDFTTSQGSTGLVSLELSPRLAYDADASVEQAVELFERLDRPNVLIKVPGTRPGAEAIEELTARGVNVNVTLLFGLAQWEAVWNAYVTGLERRRSAGESLSVISVASFFLSRIDRELDDALPAELQHTAALASATQAYSQWQRRRSEQPWTSLADDGAKPQQLLWASTSPKADELDATYYVERLIAPSTIDTMPGEVIDALCELDQIRQPRLDETDVADAGDLLAAIEQHGRRLDHVAADLQVAGVKAFEQSFQSLLNTIEDVAARQRA